MMSLCHKKSAQVTYLGREKKERVSLGEADKGFKREKIYIQLQKRVFQ
jgi:hypothetical protein